MATFPIPPSPLRRSRNAFSLGIQFTEPICDSLSSSLVKSHPLPRYNTCWHRLNLSTLSKLYRFSSRGFRFWGKVLMYVHTQVKYSMVVIQSKPDADLVSRRVTIWGVGYCVSWKLTGSRREISQRLSSGFKVYAEHTAAKEKYFYSISRSEKH